MADFISSCPEWLSSPANVPKVGSADEYHHIGIAESSRRRIKHDIFINHRGPDVKETFVSHLEEALKLKGYAPFVDQTELVPGDPVSEAINAAIQGASVHLALFTPCYAESKYCLDELADMVECVKKDPHGTVKLIPIFFKVTPTSLRHVEGRCYDKAFQHHMQRGRGSSIPVWKAALLYAADMMGFKRDNFRNESELKNAIIDRVEKIIDLGRVDRTQSDSSVSLTKLKKRRMRDSRPKLPSACPENLKSIKVSCLKLDPSSRPTFTTSCAALQSDVTSPTEATEEIVRDSNTLRLLEEEPASSSPLEPPGRRLLNEEATDCSALEPHNKSWTKAGTAYASGSPGEVTGDGWRSLVLHSTQDLNEKYFDRPDALDRLDARRAVRNLGEEHLPWVLEGLDELTECTKSRGGKLQVFRENAIQVAINLAKTRIQCVEPAMILMEALTSFDVGEENVRDSKNILLTTSIHLEYFLKLMKDKELSEAGLLAAKTVANLLVNRQVWVTARNEHDIVSAFLSISSGNENQAGVDVCLMGLSHLAEFSSKRIELPKRDSAGDKTNIIQKVLFLLTVGLKNKLLENLAKDTLVALDMEDEVSTPVEEKLSELMEAKAFSPHSTVVGRMAIISLFTKVCKRNQVFITEKLILYLLVMIKKAGEEMRSGMVAEDQKPLQKLAVELYCYCVQQERDKAQSVLTENELERRSLEGMLEKEESGIQDESRLERLETLETVIPGSSRTRITVALLVKMAKSESAQCREKVASTLLRFAQENEPEMQDEAAFDALVIIWNGRCARVFKGPDALKTALHLLGEDPTNFSSRECAHGLLMLATEEDDSIRLELASGLGRLVKFVTSHDTEEDKALLTTVLYLLCKIGKEEDVIKAEGHIFLVSSLGDNKSKEEAIRGLGILLKYPASEDAVLGAGFVDAAMRCMNPNFARTEMALASAQSSLSSEALHEMALALAKISSSAKRLDEIVECGSSEGALLNLLERCSSLEGKAAAAAVIAKLYPKLAKLEDRSRHEKLSNASSLLFKCLKETDKSQLKEFLKALAVVADGGKGMNSIHQDRGVQYLIQYFESEESDTEVRRLVLQILAEMSSVFFSETTEPTMSSTLLKDAFKTNDIGKRLCSHSLMEDNAESRINLLKIIRNYSQAGEGAGAAVSVLLEVLKRNSRRGNVLEVNELALEALANFIEDADRRRRFIASDGIKTIADVMKLNPLADSVMCYCIVILAKVIEDSRSKRDTCKAIFNCKVLTPLKDAMFHSKEPKVKWQSVVLVHLVVLHGPSSVYTAIHNEGMLHAVIELLQTVPDCRDVTTELLKCVRQGDRNCRNFIDKELLKLRLTL